MNNNKGSFESTFRMTERAFRKKKKSVKKTLEVGANNLFMSEMLPHVAQDV